MRHFNIQPAYPPQLSRHKYTGEAERPFEGRDHWSLSFIDNQGDLNCERSYMLAIRYYHGGEGGPHHYRFYMAGMGDYLLLVSPEEAEQRRRDVVEYEGEEAAKKWDLGPLCPVVASEHQLAIRDALIRRWEAVCELVSPHVTM